VGYRWLLLKATGNCSEDPSSSFEFGGRSTQPVAPHLPCGSLVVLALIGGATARATLGESRSCWARSSC